MSPEAMKHAVQKVKDSGNDKAWITDRGTMFGYQEILLIQIEGISCSQFALIPSHKFLKRQNGI